MRSPSSSSYSCSACFNLFPCVSGGGDADTDAELLALLLLAEDRDERPGVDPVECRVDGEILFGFGKDIELSRCSRLELEEAISRREQVRSGQSLPRANKGEKSESGREK